MLESFTDRAKGVIGLAGQHARRLHHPQVAPGHLLLAILSEGKGMAVSILQRFRVDIKGLRDQVDQRLAAMGSPAPVSDREYSPDAERALHRAVELAENWEHGFAGTEHLLLGLLETDEPLVRDLLGGQNIRLEDCQEEVTRLLGVGKDEDATRYTGQWLADVLRHCGIDDEVWFPPLLKTLEDVSFDEALWKPWPETLNTWQHVLHVQFWCEYASYGVRGRPLPDAHEQPPEPLAAPDPADWEQARHNLAESISSLQEDLLWLKDRLALQPCREPRLGNRAALAAGAIAHLAYHTGQIRLLVGLRHMTEHNAPKPWTKRTGQSSSTTNVTSSSS